MVYQSLLKPLLFRLEAEKAHELVYDFARKISDIPLGRDLTRLIYGYTSPVLAQDLLGLHFPNPVGLAAGFDKNGYLPEILEAAGFGFMEAGSITARASTGNARPRMFRLPDDHALVNRMGLNNDGARTVCRRLANRRCDIPVGINIAKTHDSKITGDAAINDYVLSYREAQHTADYITLNISCPNTADGRTFEEPNALDELLSATRSRDDAGTTPTLVKFSSDLPRDELWRLVERCEDHRVNGYVAVNTTGSRMGLASDPERLSQIGRGGLSGRPLFSRSLRTVGWIREIAGDKKPIIGVGGIDSFEAAQAMLRAGADLLQIYTGLVYEGPGLVRRINRGLARYLREKSLNSPAKLRQNATVQGP
ncbi:MAG: quinone-dependent dihydroorotate dehydrogenase [Balneolaceae bacterium]|nr:quinone-dependent dihydroorotate dehydrogenase [Balneolaceae bacterium]